MISLAAIPTDRPSVCLRLRVLHCAAVPYACLSYISNAATVKPPDLWLFISSPYPTTSTPPTPTDGL